MTEILKTYKEVKDANEKRGVLLANIAGLSRDLCSTILRMDATNHLDLIGRLKADIETYAGLLAKASTFIKDYDNQGLISHVAARNALGTNFTALTRELDSFGARFRSNRLVDLAINQNVNAQTLDRVHHMALEEKLEKWLESPPNMKRKQLETQKLRQEGTGLWLLEGDTFINWQDNPGSLWIQGPSGTGKSVLGSAVISKLVSDKQLFKDLKNSSPPPAVAFFYFDFKDNEGQAVETALRRIILQLSAQSPHPYSVLDEQYQICDGQTLPTYQDLLKLLKELLLELRRTYIVLDALDECKEVDLGQLLDFISVLRSWTQTPVHLLITSQPRGIFTEHLGGMPCIVLDSSLTDKDINLFVTAELLKPNFKIWSSHANYITKQVVRKSNGMFRLAACLLVEISRRWQNPEGLDKMLDSLPTDLFGIYDRFLDAIHPDDFVYLEAVLCWLIFARKQMGLIELAEAVSFDFSDPTRYVYKPSQCKGNKDAILRWLEGLVLLKNEGSRESTVTLAHASVKDYILSARFAQRFRSNFSTSLSHTFLAQTCIDYLLYFSDHPLDDTMLDSYPFARYAADEWCYHLLLCHNRSILFANAMCLLEDGSRQYNALKFLHHGQFPFLPASPLHLCCYNGYIEGVHSLLARGADINQVLEQGTPLYIAVNAGHTDVVRVLLNNNANPNASMTHSGRALSSASIRGNIGMVQLLLEKGADIDQGALQAASQKDHRRVVQLLLENGADVNEWAQGYGSALKVASTQGHTELVQFLLKHGANANALGTTNESALSDASRHGHTEVVRLLLQSGADVNAMSKRSESALEVACSWGHTEVVKLLLEYGADVNTEGGEYGSPLQAASAQARTDVVHLLLQNGADVNAPGGSKYGNALHAAAGAPPYCSNIEVLQLLLENGADVNMASGEYGSALQAASATGRTERVQFLLEYGADVNGRSGMHGTALQIAYRKGHRKIAELLLANEAVDTRGGDTSKEGALLDWDSDRAVYSDSEGSVGSV
ncbi:ankyrin repeat-containing domain protein [Mycena latifolia]|nr:ankyrin repeat-containing domain protein [Mycena latifolia]